MSIHKTAEHIGVMLDRYHLFLDKIDEQDFQTNPEAGVWSYAEVYSHIFSANYACLIAIQNCMQGKGIESKEPASLPGRLILFLGVFPPVKIKAPERIAAMVKKINKAEAKQEIEKFRENLTKLLPEIATASPSQKAKHPRMGLFNAKQWLRFIEIHTRHHEKQLYRVQAALKKP
jgi:hypothetical protein